MTLSHALVGLVVSLIGIAFAWAAGALALVMLPVAAVVWVSGRLWQSR